MTSNKIRKAFLDFFEKKEHKIIASSSLIPADPTSLFTSAGMQQFTPYLSGEVEPPYKRACSVQKCVRVNDIDEVGDEFHHSFFEMLGNWSFGDYFKQEAIDFALEFLLDVLKLDKKKIWISVFIGEKGIPKDKESIKLWQEKGIVRERIFEFGMKDNFWGPVTNTGPCGPCSEVFYDLTGISCEKENECGPNCECGRFVEIWNLVFMEYNKTIDGKFEKLAQQNVDTGVGFERLCSLLQEKPSDYETDLFWSVILEIEKQCNKKYIDNKKEFRILADHIRASCFIIADGVLPSNTDKGYILRMILRRMIRYARTLGLNQNWHDSVIKKVNEIYGDVYPEIGLKQEQFLDIIQKEHAKFEKTLESGLKQLKKLLKKKESSGIVTGSECSTIYQTFGLPLEIIREEIEQKGMKIENEQAFRQEMNKHKDISRAGAEKKFGGVGIDQIKDEDQKSKATKLHTATHLLHSALRQVLGEHVQQMGSDITPERLRFDFSHSEKISQQDLEQIQNIVNQKIQESLIVEKQETPYNQAVESGALAFFKQKYPEIVNVYTIKNDSNEIFSKEICAGPHVKNTLEIGKFKIIKQESVGANTRRIKAILNSSV